MAIQFRCESCRQPVEVDDEAAGQMVSCPFCQQLSVAPVESDQSISHDVPTAAPSSAVPEVPSAGFGPRPVPGGPFLSSPPPTERNKIVDSLGWVALACLGLATICFAVCAAQLAPAVPQQVTPDMDVAELTKKQMDIYRDKPWLVFANLLVMLLPLLSAVLSIVSLVLKGRPIWPAIVSLVACGGMLCMMGLTFLMFLG